jgi:GT2 family glycosyltransferase
MVSFHPLWGSSVFLRTSLRSRIPQNVRRRYQLWRACLLSLGLRQRRQYDSGTVERQASAQISVVVAIHDAPEVTQRCLRSLERNGGGAQIVLVDDGSKLPRTRKILDEVRQCHRWEVIRHDVAVGHSRSCEHGAQLCRRPYLCLLNSDTVVTPWTWAGVVDAFGHDPQIAVVGPATSCAATAQKLWRAECCRWACTDLQIEEFARRYTRRHRASPLVDLDCAGGFAFFIRREVWENSGGFDKSLANYGNETELCTRLKGEGLRVVWTRASYVHHFGEASFLQRFSAKELHSQRVAATRYIGTKHDPGQGGTTP